jgi:hypothetical protein
LGPLAGRAKREQPNAFHFASDAVKIRKSLFNYPIFKSFNPGMLDADRKRLCEV